MLHTENRKEINEQKELLKKCFADYDAKYHFAFVDFFNQILDRFTVDKYMKERGIE